MQTSADTLGSDGVFVDPLWRVRIALSPLEQELLGCWWVRRLGFIQHAGAASVATTQSYTRLEHSLGLLALVVHFSPEDAYARVAALLHDIGHLAFSHTLEHLAGLDHHRLGTARIRDLAPLLTRHDLDPDRLIAVVDGSTASGLRGVGAGLRLDHLESFVRSGRAHGRTAEPPPRTLGNLRLVGGVVDTDPVTADYLRRLVVAEAHAQNAPSNLVTVAVLRDLTARLLRADPALRPSLPTLTDDRLWARLLGEPSTSRDADRLRRDPGGWQVVGSETGDDPEAILIDRTRHYLDLPTVDGTPMAPIDPAAEGLSEVPYTAVVVPLKGARRRPSRPGAP